MARKRKPKPNIAPWVEPPAKPQKTIPRPPEPSWEFLYSDTWQGDDAGGQWVSERHRVVNLTLAHVSVEWVPPIRVPGEILTISLSRKELVENGFVFSRQAMREYFTSPRGSPERGQWDEWHKEERRKKAEGSERFWEQRRGEQKTDEDRWQEWKKIRREQRKKEQEWRHQWQEYERNQWQEYRQENQQERDEARRRTEEELKRILERMRQMAGGRGYRPQYLIDLDLPVGATREQIKKQMVKLTMQHHPDRGGNPEDFIRVNAAYEMALLMTPE
jgi:hypothetical protein